MALVDSQDLDPWERLPGWTGRFFDTEYMTFALYEIAADAVPLHEHHHPQEEVWNVVEGEVAVIVGGIQHIAGPGCAVVVPSNTPHSATAHGACRVLVVDSPVRDDGRPGSAAR